ncbi:hypothetical protein [Staphylococcus aureus]|uniref:hypothetical protein n=1 Tax=Staphylococcus aureus TaxID=1280 RepID=UPI0004154CB6|nr:hypothetical protein [Staphylococcus aureus]
MGPNTEADEKSAYNNVQVGVGPNTEADGKSAYNNVQVGDGPQHSEFRNEILQAMQVGVGPNTEADGKSAYNNAQVGVDDEINFAKISFLSHLTQNKFHYPQNKQLTI